MNGIHLFIFIKYLSVLKGTAPAVLVYEDLHYRSFSAQATQFFHLN